MSAITDLYAGIPVNAAQAGARQITPAVTRIASIRRNRGFVVAD
jgi:hypothetical protein